MPGEHILHPHGDLDAATVEDVRQHWSAVVAQHRPDRVVLDLADVTFVDSMGLSAVVMLRNRQAAHGGALVIVNASAMTAKILQVTGLDQIIDVTRADPGLDPTRTRQDSPHRSSV